MIEIMSRLMTVCFKKYSLFRLWSLLMWVSRFFLFQWSLCYRQSYHTLPEQSSASIRLLLLCRDRFCLSSVLQWWGWFLWKDLQARMSVLYWSHGQVFWNETSLWYNAPKSMLTSADAVQCSWRQWDPDRRKALKHRPPIRSMPIHAFASFLQGGYSSARQQWNAAIMVERVSIRRFMFLLQIYLASFIKLQELKKDSSDFSFF